ncbi:MAG TPA: BamA/TamA family outer membrane protein [Ignavibacteria bacterium]
MNNSILIISSSKLKYIFILIQLILFFSVNLSSQIKINKISIQDFDDISSNKLFELLLLKENTIIDTLLLSNRLDTLKNFLFQNGYVCSTLELSYKSNSNSELYELIIKPKDISQIYFNNIKIINDSSENISKILQNYNNVFFNENVLKNIINQLLNEYENQGFPFAIIRIDSINFFVNEKYYIDLKLKVEKGITFKIDSIAVFGNKITNDNVIIKNSRVKKGTFYEKKIIDNVPKNLMQLEIFESVKNPTLYLDSNNIGIMNISVKESNTFGFDAILGYQPSSETSEKGYISGMLNFAFKNLFGSARKLSVFWQRDTKSSQTINLEYTEPNLLGYFIKTKVKYYQREQDSLFVLRNIAFSNTMSLFEGIFGSLIFSYQSTIPGSENTYSFYNKSKLYSIGFEFNYDTRDDYRLPKKGTFIRNYFEIGNKYYYSSILNKKDKIVKKIDIGIQLFNNLLKNQILYNSFQGRMILTDNEEQTDLFYLGGINTIRGYRDNQFMVSSAIWLNNEYRFLFSDNSSFYPFFDLGYYKRNNTIDGLVSSEDFIYSYGLGLDFASNFGIIRLNLSLGKGDNLSRMKVHIGFKNNF